MLQKTSLLIVEQRRSIRIVFGEVLLNSRHKTSCLKNFVIALNLLELQCWFKLTGQNALNLKFKTRFSQIGLSLGENLWRQNLLKT